MVGLLCAVTKFMGLLCWYSVALLMGVAPTINAMVAAETMEGINGNKSYGLPHKLVIDVLKKYSRIK